MNAPRDARRVPQIRPADARDVSLAFRAFGLNLGIVLCDAVSPEDLAGVLPPGHLPIASGPLDRVLRLDYLSVTESPVARRGFHWFDEDAFRHFALTPEQSVEYAESVIEHRIAESAAEFTFIHAGVIVWRGAAVIMPGASHSGKSTLVRALVNAGATYFSDEYAVLALDGRVFPYMRRLSQREGPFGPKGRVDLASHAPTAEQTRNGAPVAIVALTRFEGGRAWRVEQLGPGTAIMALSQHVIALRHRPADAFSVMRRVVEGAVVVEGVRGDANDAATRILDASEGEDAATIARLLVAGAS